MLKFLENFLASLYIHGETTFEVEEDGKRKSVKVERTEYNLTEEAITALKQYMMNGSLKCAKRIHMMHYLEVILLLTA